MGEGKRGLPDLKQKKYLGAVTPYHTERQQPPRKEIEKVVAVLRRVNQQMSRTMLVSSSRQQHYHLNQPVLPPRLVLDLRSCWMQRQHHYQPTSTVHIPAARTTEPVDERNVVEETANRVTSASYTKRSKAMRWTKEETYKFYTGLRKYGTSFGMISLLFPNRERRHIKLKFLREEANHPELPSLRSESDYPCRRRIHAPVCRGRGKQVYNRRKWTTGTGQVSCTQQK